MSNFLLKWVCSLGLQKAATLVPLLESKIDAVRRTIEYFKGFVADDLHGGKPQNTEE